MKTRALPWLACLLSGWFLVPATAREWRVPGDFETIQAAIDAAAPGDHIRIGPGTYRERITLKPDLVLRSEGDDTAGNHGLKRAEQTIIDGEGAGDEEAPGVTMAEGAVLDGFTVTGIGKYDEALWQKHWDEQGENQSHEHIGHFGTPGIAIAGVSCTVRHNRVHHIGDTGIAIRGADGKTCAPLVEKNHCFRNMGGGIGSMGGSTALIRGNTCFENFFAGIGHDNASPLVIDNTCFENIRAGIGISEGACPVVRGNRCYRNRRAGIGVRTGSETRPVIEGNECYENAMAGIGAEEESEPLIRNNRCHHNALAGIGTRHHAKPVIIGNHCTENGASGIGSDGASPILLRNHLERNQTAGIGISAGSHALVIENTCLENRLVAVGLPGGSDAVLVNNSLTRSEGMPPLVAVLEGSTATLVGNTLEGGGVAGVMVQGTAVIQGNTIQGTGRGSGIWIRDEGKAEHSGNAITGFATEIKPAP